MKKLLLVVLVIAFAGIYPAFAQTASSDVAWNGYQLEGVKKDAEEFYSIFLDALQELDEGNDFLNIIDSINYKRKLPDTPFIINGEIKKTKNGYTIRTKLSSKGEGDLAFYKYVVAENEINSTIKEHAENVYKHFINLRNRLENNIINNDLSRAEQYISDAASDSIPDSAAKEYYETAEEIIAQAREKIEVSKNTQLREKLKEVEKKLRDCEKIFRSAVYAGGLSFCAEKPLFKSITSDIDLMELYPGIVGLSLRYVTPQFEYFRWYAQFSYAGINGGIKESPAAYISDASLQFFSFSLGWHFQFYPSKLFAPYAYLGIGYTHLIESAADGADSASLHYMNGLVESGVGTRIYLGSMFALEARAQGNIIVGETIILSANFSVGASFLFHDRKYLGKN